MRVDSSESTLWDKWYNILKLLGGCAIAAIFFGVAEDHKISNTTIEVFILLFLPSLSGMIGKGESKFNRFKRHDS